MRKILPVMLLLLAACRTFDSDIVWLDEPTDTFQRDSEWLKAFPIGNGSLGAMVYGGVALERLQLNEESMWSGRCQQADNPEAAQYLPEIRRLLLAGNYREATELTNRTQRCVGAGSGRGHGAHDPYGSFQTGGDLWLDFGPEAASDVVDYRRELNMREATVTVSYERNGVKYRRESFVSYPDQVLVLRLTADKPSSIGFACRLTRPERSVTRCGENMLVMSGSLDDGDGGEGLHYMIRAKVLASGGTTACQSQSIHVAGADEVVILLSASTDYVQAYPDYRGRDYRRITALNIARAESLGYETLRKRHTADFGGYYNRVRLHLGDDKASLLPLDERLERFRTGASDPGLYEAMFNYGRYLLISSSRENTLPANLQGLWSNKLQTPWNGDYHLNINLQMNYWPAEVCNLSELHQPLFALIRSLREPGQKTARTQYGCRGWVVHTITNPWGYTSPGEQPSWGMYVAGAAWICQHIMEHYRFTGDKDFLRQMYPALRGASEFYLDWLVEDRTTHRLLSGPSNSPENTFYTRDGYRASICMGPTHDNQVLWQLFSDLEEACRELSLNDSLVARACQARERLPQTRIGRDGRILEWPEEFREAEPNHRHLSHLFALHPGSRINPHDTPALAEAARRSIHRRLHAADGVTPVWPHGQTGWSSAWLISQFARLGDGESALSNLDFVLKQFTVDNLFTIHPPFQIDASFGTTAGIAEMLLQSHMKGSDDRYILKLLPAVPASWRHGEVKGLRARGGYTVSMKWKDGTRVRVTITSHSGRPFVLSFGERMRRVDNLGVGETATYTL